jgi:aromatic ring hydroxylase
MSAHAHDFLSIMLTACGFLLMPQRLTKLSKPCLVVMAGPTQQQGARQKRMQQQQQTRAQVQIRPMKGVGSAGQQQLRAAFQNAHQLLVLPAQLRQDQQQQA